MTQGGNYETFCDEKGSFQISKEQKRFAEAYIDNDFNATATYQKLHPKAEYNNARSQGGYWARKDEIKRYVELRRKEIFEELKVDETRVLTELASIGFAQKGDEVYLTRDKLKALELLGKHLQLFEKKEADTSADTTINITFQD